MNKKSFSIIVVLSLIAGGLIGGAIATFAPQFIASFTKPSIPKILADCGVVETSEDTINPYSARVLFSWHDYHAPNGDEELKCIGKTLGIVPVKIWKLFNSAGSIDFMLNGADYFGEGNYRNIQFHVQENFEMENRGALILKLTNVNPTW